MGRMAQSWRRLLRSLQLILIQMTLKGSVEKPAPFLLPKFAEILIAAWAAATKAPSVAGSGLSTWGASALNPLR